MGRSLQNLRAALASLALTCIPGGDVAAQPAYSYALIVGPTASVDGFTPSSLTDSGEVIYADNFNGTISTTTETLAQVDDVIGGERLSWVAPGSDTSLNEHGEAAFESRFGDADLPAIFTPTDLLAKHGGSVGGTEIQSPASPSINDSGDVVFTANVCPSGVCVQSAIFRNDIEEKRTPFSDGFHELRAISHPVVNNDGLMAFYGQSDILNDVAAVHHFRSGQSVWRVLFTGETIPPGIVLGHPRGVFAGLDLNDEGDIATSWKTDTGKWIVLMNGDLVAQAGDVIDGVTLTELSSHRPALNDAGVVVFRARHAGGDGAFTQTQLVLTSGQQIGGQTVQFIGNVAINDSGAIALQVAFEGGIGGIVLATPLGSNHYVRMRTGSAVALRQNVDVPADPFAMRVDHRFATTTGQLSVRLDGDLIGSASAPGSLDEAVTRSVFQVSGAVLGRPDVTLELELDGPTGATLQVDNVYFPGLVNGSFEDGDLSDWETAASGTGSVELVPEPSALLSGLACVLTLWALTRRSRTSSPESL